MPISVQTPIIEHVPNGVTTVFAYPVAILDAEDLKAQLDGAPFTAFTVSGVGSRTGGSITCTSAPTGASLILYREISLARATDYQELGDLLAETLDDDFDRVWMAVQDLGATSERSMRVPVGETLPILPEASSRAERVLGFDSNGDPIMVTRTEDGGAALGLDLASSAGASLIGFLQSGAGAVARTLQSKGRETVSVSDFMSESQRADVFSGTASLDVSDAAQKAINLAQAMGRGVVVFPPGGTYYLNAQINLCDNLILWGYGAKLKLGSAWKGLNKPLFKNFSGTEFTAPGSRLASQNIAFLGFEIDGQDAGVNGSTVADANMHGVILCCGGWTANTGVDGLVVKDCHMYSFAGAGVMVWKSSNVSVSDNRFLNFFANTSLSIGSCIDFHEVQKAVISDNQINHTALGLSWHGMVVLDWDAGSSDITITGNVITNMNGGDGISCEGNSTDNLARAVISGNVIKSCLGQGVGVDRCVSAVVSDNIIESVGGPAILFTATEELVAVGNKITTTGLGGIMSASGVTRANIADNIISGVTYYDANYRGEGVSVADVGLGAANQINITGNIIKDTAGAGVYAVCRNPVVEANNIYNAGTSASLGATLRAGILCTDFGVVSNNLIVSAGDTHYAVSSGASDFPSIDNNRIRGSFLTAYYYIGYRQTGIAHAISVSIEDARYDTTSNIFTGRYNGTPAGYWYRGDTMYATQPSSAGYIGAVVTATPSTWKTFGLIS